MQACRGLRRVPAQSLMHRRRVLDKTITYVGLDVHKDTIAVALAEAGGGKDVREYGKIANTPAALKALAAKLSRAGNELRFCYEAGPCGYGIQRQLTLAGHGCVVVAPSLIPRKPGDRIKTDRRDAINLARLHRAGELTAVWVPDQAHEAIRDLVRARLAAVRSLRQARQQLSGFLLRHGRHYNRPAWTLMHRRWMAALSPAPRFRGRRACIGLPVGRWPRWCAPCRRYAMVWSGGDIVADSPPRPPSFLLHRRHAPQGGTKAGMARRAECSRCLELSVPGAHQPRATAAARGPGQAYP